MATYTPRPYQTDLYNSLRNTPRVSSTQGYSVGYDPARDWVEDAVDRHRALIVIEHTDLVEGSHSVTFSGSVTTDFVLTTAGIVGNHTPMTFRTSMSASVLGQTVAIRSITETLLSQVRSFAQEKYGQMNSYPMSSFGTITTEQTLQSTTDTTSVNQVYSAMEEMKKAIISKYYKDLDLFQWAIPPLPSEKPKPLPQQLSLWDDI